MQVAELFVSLGVKGSDKTVAAFAGVNKGIKDVASTSLLAKAAILGAVYSLEKLFEAAAAKGTVLSNLAAYSGMDIKALQQWSYAAQQAGASQDEFTASVKAMNDTIAKSRFSKQSLFGISEVDHIVGFDMEKAYKDRMYALRQFMEFAKKETDIDMRNQILKANGFSENSIAALVKGNFSPEMLSQAPIVSEKSADALAKIESRFKNIGTSVSMLATKLTLEHGNGFLTGIEKIWEAVKGLIGALDEMGKKLGIFELIQNVAEFAAIAIRALRDAVNYFTAGSSDDEKRKRAAYYKENPFGFYNGNNDVNVLKPMGEWFKKKFSESEKAAAPLSKLIEKDAAAIDEKDRKERLAADAIAYAKFNASSANGEKIISAPFRALFGFLGNAADQLASVKAQDIFPRRLTEGAGASAEESEIYRFLKGSFDQPAPIRPPLLGLADPKVSAQYANQSGNNQNVVVNQNLNFQHPGIEHDKTADSSSKGIYSAMQQLYTRTQAS